MKIFYCPTCGIRYSFKEDCKINICVNCDATLIEDQPDEPELEKIEIVWVKPEEKILNINLEQNGYFEPGLIPAEETIHIKTTPGEWKKFGIDKEGNVTFGIHDPNEGITITAIGTGVEETSTSTGETEDSDPFGLGREYIEDVIFEFKNRIKKADWGEMLSLRKGIENNIRGIVNHCKKDSIWTDKD